jgi:hypothetical protein
MSFYSEQRDAFTQAVRERELDLCQRYKEAREADDMVTLAAIAATPEYTQAVAQARAGFIKAITSYPQEHSNDMGSMFTLKRAEEETIRVENEIKGSINYGTC